MSLGQILVKQRVHYRGPKFYPIFMKLCQNVIFMKSRPQLKVVHAASKTRSLGQF